MESRRPTARIQLQHVGRAEAHLTLRMTQSLLDAYPERIAGTGPCLRAGRYVADMLRRHCDRVCEERFRMHPGSLWNVGRVVALAYAAAASLLIVGGRLVYVSTAVCLLGLAYGVTHYILCGDLFDRLFPAAEGCNAVGVIEPAGEARQQILVVGHHDGPYVLSFLLHFRQLAGLRLLLAIASYLFLTVSSIVGAVVQTLGPLDWRVRGVHLIFVLLGLSFVAPLFGLITRTPSPGAGDNLNASVMAVRIAGYFASRKQRGTPLENTRLVLLSTDGEEAGQRGAIAYAERHKADLLAIPTFALNIDCVYSLADLAALVRDRSGTVPLSARMASECSHLASDLGYCVKEVSLPFGAGGTDAAAFARVGVESTTLIGMSTSLVGERTGDGIVYHAPEDTVEHIQPEAVEAVLDIAINFVIWKDCDASPAPFAHVAA